MREPRRFSIYQIEEEGNVFLSPAQIVHVGTPRASRGFSPIPSHAAHGMRGVGQKPPESAVYWRLAYLDSFSILSCVCSLEGQTQRQGWRSSFRGPPSPAPPSREVPLVTPKGASITASATPFCFCMTQKHLTIERIRHSRS